VSDATELALVPIVGALIAIGIVWIVRRVTRDLD
jgi:hypothetical protein